MCVCTKPKDRHPKAKTLAGCRRAASRTKRNLPPKPYLLLKRGETLKRVGPGPKPLAPSARLGSRLHHENSEAWGSLCDFTHGKTCIHTYEEYPYELRRNRCHQLIRVEDHFGGRRQVPCNCPACACCLRDTFTNALQEQGCDARAHDAASRWVAAQSVYKLENTAR